MANTKKIKRINDFKMAKSSQDKEFLNYDVETEKADALDSIAKALQDITLTARGKDGEKGESIKGEKGDKGDNGKDADESKILKSIISKIPKPVHGINGINGQDGKDADEVFVIKRVLERIPVPTNGKDGSSDTAEDIRNKLELLDGEERLDAKYIKNIDQYAKKIFERVNDFVGSIISFSKNGSQIGNGSSLNIVAGTNINIQSTFDGNTANYTINSAGSGGTTYTETPTGAINSSNVTYTVAHTITTIYSFAINGQFLHPTADYTFTGVTITFTSPLDASLSGKPFTIVYA